MPILTVAEKVRAMLVEHLGVDDEEVTPDALIINDLGADSLDTIEIVMSCEEDFDIEIPDEDAEKVRTVADMIAYLEGRMTAKTPVHMDGGGHDG